MVVLPIFNFIMQHFLLANVRSVVIFNCWPVETQIAFSQFLSQNSLFSQFVRFNRNGALEDVVSKYLQHRQPALGVFADLNCGETEELLSQASRLYLYNSHHRWLILNAAANLTHFRQLFAHVNLKIDADLTCALYSGSQSQLNATSITAYDVYNNGNHIGGKLNITADREWRCSVADCQVQRYLSDLHKRTKYGNRCSMRDVTMRMATVVSRIPLNSPQEELLADLISIDDPSVHFAQRFGFQFTMTLVEYLDCNVAFIFTDRWSSDLVYGGALGEMINGTADFISTPLVAYLERGVYLSMLRETSIIQTTCVFRAPRNIDIVGSAFMKPFSAAVWLVFAFILLLITFLLWLAFFVELHRLRLCWSYMPSIMATFLISFGSACTQGSLLIPCSSGGRMVFLTLSLISFIVYNYYTSLVVSSLLDSPVKSKIRSLDLLADSSLDVGLEPLSYTKSYLASSRLPDVRKFVRRKVEPRANSSTLWMSIKEGLQRVRNQPGFAYIFEFNTGYAYISRHYYPQEICSLNEFLFRPERNIYTQMPKNSSYKEVFRLKTVRLLETGINLKMKQYWVRSKLKCEGNNYFVGVGMENVAFLFLMLSLAYVVAVIVLLLEVVHKRTTLS